MLSAFTSFQVIIASDALMVLPSGYNPSNNDAAANSIRANAWQRTEILVSSSTPVPKEFLSLDLTIDGTLSYELDLSDAPIVGAEDGSGNPTDGEDLDGHKLFYAEFSTIRDSGANAGNITVKPSASNGYEIFGASNEIDIPPDTHVVFYNKASSLGDISNAGDRLITFEGAENDKIRVKLCFEA